MGVGLLIHLETPMDTSATTAEYSDWTEGFRIYQRLGILSLGAGHSRKMDEILRRSQWLQSQELHGQRTPEEVKAK